MLSEEFKEEILEAFVQHYQFNIIEPKFTYDENKLFFYDSRKIVLNDIKNVELKNKFTSVFVNFKKKSPYISYDGFDIVFCRPNFGNVFYERILIKSIKKAYTCFKFPINKSLLYPIQKLNLTKKEYNNLVDIPLEFL